MEFGWCTDISNAQLLYDTGFSYIEGFVTALCLEDSERSKEMIARYKQSPLPPKAFCILLPGDLKVVGPNVDRLRLDRYIGRTIEVMGELGAEILVFGSGGARRIPDGWPKEKAEDQIVEFLTLMADKIDIAELTSRLTVAIEPLNKKESNIINSISEAAELAKRVDRGSVRVLADFYHMSEEGESLDTLIDNKDWLAHIHVADTGRLVPGTGGYPYADFASALQTAGYSGRISVECHVKNLQDEAPAALDYLRKIWPPAADQNA